MVRIRNNSSCRIDVQNATTCASNRPNGPSVAVVSSRTECAASFTSTSSSSSSGASMEEMVFLEGRISFPDDAMIRWARRCSS